MGHGIAQVHAAVGKHVTLYEPELARAEAGRGRVVGNLDRQVAKGKVSSEERDAIVGRVAVTDDPGAVADVDLAIEAVFEDLDVKTRLWSELDRLAAPATTFATNTSSISIDRLAAAVADDRRTRFVGMHFFSPVPVMPLVEVIRGSATSDDTERSIRDLAAELGKQTIVSADRPGFLVNRILMPFLGEAIRTWEEGTGTKEDIDTGAKLGLNHPMGPFELADWIGLDVCLEVMRVLYEGIGAEHLRPPRSLENLVAEGHLGRKTKQGFYTYD
jgi:3-hydroxybutyryl-CoA dehydrogenase